MAADPSIFSSYLQPVRSVLDYSNDMDKRDMNALQLVAQLRSNEIADLTAQQTREQLGQNTAKRNALQAIYSHPDAVDPIKLENMQLSNPLTMAEGQAMRKARVDAAHVQAQTANQASLAGKNTADSEKTTFEMQQARTQQHLQQLIGVGDVPSAHRWLDEAVASGELPADRAQAAKAKLEADPGSLGKWKIDAVNGGMSIVQQREQQWKANEDARSAATTAATNANRDLIIDPARPGAYVPNAPLIDAKKQIAAAGVAPQMAYSVHTNPVTGDAMAIPNKGAPGRPLEAIPINVGGKPLKGPDQNKPTADYLKQAEAYRNMDDALTNFTTKLGGFTNSDMMIPTRRAEIATAYNNAMLQGKEIYKLGVLNGGDERILNGILANPISFTGATLPTSAMQKQARDLQAIIARGNENLSTVNRQQRVPLKSESGPAVPDDIQALLQKHGGR